MSLWKSPSRLPIPLWWIRRTHPALHIIKFVLHSFQTSVEMRDLNDRICLFHDCSLRFHFLLLLFLPFSALCVQSVFHISCKKALQPGMRQLDP